MRKKLKKLKRLFRKSSTLTKILIILGAFDFLFIVTMIVIFCFKGMVPDTLITCVLGASGAEGLFSAAIQITKLITNKKEETEENYNDLGNNY